MKRRLDLRRIGRDRSKKPENAYDVVPFVVAAALDSLPTSVAMKFAEKLSVAAPCQQLHLVAVVVVAVVVVVVAAAVDPRQNSSYKSTATPRP